MTKQCPHCGFKRAWKLRRNKLKCKRCRREFSIKTYWTVLGIKTTEKEWRACINIFLRQRTIQRIFKETGIGHCKIEKMVGYLRQLMLNDIPDPFQGTTEIDETYIGGQRKNKKLHIRILSPPKSGHGTDKLPIIGIFNRDSKRVYIQVLDRTERGWHTKFLKVFQIIKEHTVENSTIYTDSYPVYRSLAKYHPCNHQMINHDGGEYSKGDLHINNIEGFWGILKRKLGCIGGMKRDNLKYFVAEITWKFNHKSLTYQEQEEILLNLVKNNIGG